MTDVGQAQNLCMHITAIWRVKRGMGWGGGDRGPDLPRFHRV